MLSSLLKITNTACGFVAGDYGIESFRRQNAFFFFCLLYTSATGMRKWSSFMQ